MKNTENTLPNGYSPFTRYAPKSHVLEVDLLLRNKVTSKQHVQRFTCFRTGHNFASIFGYDVIETVNVKEV